MLGIGKKAPKKPSKVELALMEQVAGLTRENESLKGQLHFWHEHSRTLENKVMTTMREQLQMLEAFRRTTNSPPEFHDMIKKAQESFDTALGDHLGTAALILAVSLAGTRQTDVIGQLIPSLQPLLAQLETAVPERPPTQFAAVGASELGVRLPLSSGLKD